MSVDRMKPAVRAELKRRYQLPLVRGRFFNKVDQRSDGECWVFTGGTKDGYGWFCVYGKFARKAHQVAWELVVLGGNAVPAGTHIHHLCENRACCNPSHLCAIDANGHSTLHATQLVLFDREAA